MKFSYLIKSIFTISIFFLFLPSILFAQTQSNATSIPQFNASFNETYNGEANGDHWWKFNAKAGEGVTVLITGHFDASYAEVSLYNESGTKINYGVYYVYNNTTKFFHESIAVTGTYYIKVSGGALGTYDLAVYQAWYNTGINDNNRDFYSDFTTARYLSNGDYVRTSLASGNPLTDYYRFTANAGSSLNITVTGNFSSGYVNLYLYDGNHVEIGSQNYIYSGETKTLSENINLNGLYYLVVSGSGVGQYTLSVSGANSNINSDADALKDAAEYYHGSNPLQADTDTDGVDDNTELTLGNKPIAHSEYSDSEIGKQFAQATLIPYRDKKTNAEYLNGDHWWKFNAVSQEEVTIALTGHLNSGFLYTKLYDESGTQINYGDYGIGSVDDKERKFVSQVIPSTGTYYLKVSGSSAYGNYDLTLYNDRSHTSLTDEDRDFYFNHPTARYLSNGSFSRYSQLDGDGSFNQYFYFTANAGSTLNISLAGHFNTNYVGFEVFYISGTELAGMSANYIYDGETESRSKQLNINGSFYLKVYGDGVGKYDLTVSGFNASQPVPGTVGGVQATDGTFTDKVRITWNSVATAINYKIYRCSNNSTASCSLLSTDPSSPYNDTSGVVGTTYYYRVKACNSSGCSMNYSGANSGYRSSGSVPGTVTGVNATDGTYPNKIRTIWNSVSTATSYKVYRCNTSSTSSCNMIGSPTSTTYDDISSESGVFYYYRVKACNSAGCSVNYSSSNSGYKTEPNDTMATANNIKLNSQLRQSIEPVADVDWVKFTLSSSSSLRIRTFYSTNDDTVLWLYDANGSEIASNDDANEATRYSEISYNCSSPLSAGTYYMRIESYYLSEIPAYFLILDNVESCNSATSIIPIILMLLDD